MCDKGCNLNISRREYQMNDCSTHWANRTRILVMENKKLSDEINSLADHVRFNEEDIKTLGEELNHQKEHTEHLLNQHQEVVTKLRDDVNRLKEHFAMLNVNRQKVDVPSDVPRKSKISQRKWREFVNMKIESNVLEVDEVTQISVARSFYALERKYSFFKLKILSEGDFEIGICHEFEPGLCTHSSCNDLCFSTLGTKLEVNDIIECGILYPKNIEMDTVRVYILLNGHLRYEKKVRMPQYGFFPKIIMSGGSKVELIELPNL